MLLGNLTNYLSDRLENTALLRIANIATGRESHASLTL